MTIRTALSFIVGFLAICGIGGSIFFFTHEPNNEGFVQHPNITFFHVTLGAIYLLLAPFQFSKKIRNKFLTYHRWSGRILVSIGLVVGAAALFLGLVIPYSGISEQFVIAFFGTFFLVSLVKGFVYARAKEIALHREWMLRAFAIGLSIATMRLIFIPALIIIGDPTRQDTESLSIIAFTIAFILHSGFAEFWIRYTRPTLAKPVAVTVS